MADRKLARSVVLRDGTILSTIGDAATLIEKLSKGRTKDILKYLLMTLLKAAESGTRNDLGKVTEQLEHVLYYANLLPVFHGRHHDEATSSTSVSGHGEHLVS